MVRHELIRLARELHTIHGLLPVPVAGKIPLGGDGWNLMPFETRIAHAHSSECTGIGIQMGLIFHPVLGPVEARGVDCDIYDRQKSMLFAGTLQQFFQPTHWRWGRSPATLIFTNPGVIKNEKFGPVQLLGAGKQIVYWGQYRNKAPLPTDPPEYWLEGQSIFDMFPPFVPAEKLKTALETSCAAAGYPAQKSMLLSDAVPLSSDDLATLTAETVERFGADVKSMLIEIEHMPVGTGRGTKLFNVGLKYGALIKASGMAPTLVDAAGQQSNYVAYETINNPILGKIGQIAEIVFTQLKGTLGGGDRRDFSRGVASSIGLAQTIEVHKSKQTLVQPSGRGHPGEKATDLAARNLPSLRYLVSKYLTDSGCILLVGKPKIGKSWIAMELGFSISEGGEFWNEQCEQGEALMYLLEDSDRRVKDRMHILRPLATPANVRFRYAKDGPYTINHDGTGTFLDDVRAHVQAFPVIRVVILDVLQQVRGLALKTDNAYQTDYKLVSSISRLAAELNVLIVVVHHVKKGKVDDAIDSISGSFGVVGAADGAIIIGRDGDIVRVESRMRDIPDFEFELVKEDNSPMWKPAQTATELFAPPEGTKAQLVLTRLREAACALTAGDLAKRTEISERNVGTYLQRLLKNNQVSKVSRGFYIAHGVPDRDRIMGVIDLLKRANKTPVTTELKLQYAPNMEIPPEASYMMLTDVAIKEIEGSFVHGKEALTSLKHRGLAVFNSDTLWLIGDEWGPKQPVKVVNPFAFKYPWE